MSDPTQVDKQVGGEGSADASPDLAELSEWFKDRPRWLQDAARRLLQNGQVSTSDLLELAILCKREAGVTVDGLSDLTAKPLHGEPFAKAGPAVLLKLDAIGEIKGINALGPRKPLEFGPEPLTVIYGSNSSGKSGYMRILKHVCGARTKRHLLGHVFKPATEEKSCKLSYTLNGAKGEIDWTPDVGVHDDLRAVSIYDTDCAHVYVNEENEVTYEPPLLTVFRVLVDVCDQVDLLIAKEIDSNVSAKPPLPLGFASTECGTWYNTLTRLTTKDEVDARCSWNEELEAELAVMHQRLGEAKPAEKAKALRKTKTHLDTLCTLLGNIEKQLKAESLVVLGETKADSRARRHAADIDASRVFENSPLGGVASESWRLLWEQARAYSESEVYKEVPFPNVGDAARCVLCQQPLSNEAVGRFQAFEAFVRGNLEREAADAEKRLEALLTQRLQIPSSDDLDAKLDLGGVSDEGVRAAIRAHCDMLRQRELGVITGTEPSQLPPLPDGAALKKLSEIGSGFEAQAKGFEEDAKADQRTEIEARTNELSVHKWLSQQKGAIVSEISRLNAMHLLEGSRRLTNTKALSEKKSALSDLLVTAAFRIRFENELEALGASRIKVKIEKTKTTKGQVWHQIQLIGNTLPVNAGEVLSEGEFRIVSIAAFLADVSCSGGSAPVLFDDPISSLDQDFEEFTAARLADLCKTRQVIVLTHRLSLLALLEDSAESAGVKSRIISLQHEPWGAGEPNEPPLIAQKPKQALNTLLDHTVSKATKTLQEQGNAAYSIEAKALCSDIRITIERLIEYDLLADVVQRFRRPIMTMGKLDKTAKIRLADCTFLDGMMTKYSRYEHSQPKEAPVALPGPDELAADLQRLKDWQQEFNERPMSAA